MNTIKGRIFSAFIVFLIFLAPVILFSFKSLQRIDNSKDLRDKVANFNVDLLKASSSFAQIWDYDIRKDSFYLYFETENTSQFFDQITHSKETMDMIYSIVPKEKEKIHAYLNTLQNDLTEFESLVNKAINLHRKRGFRDFGLEGKMRRNIHSLESEVVGIPLSDILMLRRREKDFFLRDDKIYVEQLNAQCNTILERLKKNEAKNAPTIQVLSNYQIMFNEIVALENEIGNETKGIIASINQITHELDQTADDLYDMINNDTTLLIANIKSSLILLFIATSLFSFLFALLFSNYISRPIKGMIHDMDIISDKGFMGTKKLKSRLELVEIKKLTKAYNQLIKRIRHQINTLHKTNEELNSVNIKLMESENELKEASKIKDKFFSIISHDLRGHTGNVVSLAQMLNQKTTINDEERVVFTKYLIDSSQNLQLLLDNLLNWAKSQMNNHQIEKRSFCVSKLITKNIALFQETALRKGIQIKYNQQLSSKAYADKDMVDFVIRNLLSNALKFTSKEDTIIFSVSEHENSLSIHVKDSGVGMTPEQVQKLSSDTDESFTTEGTNREKGTGLGFSICKDFAKRNSGHIKITSEKDKGSEFVFTIPSTLTKEALLVS